MDMNNIKLAARMALEAYSDSPTMEGFSVSPFCVGNIQGFSARKNDELWIVFCGTNDVKDWLDNLDARKEMMEHGCVHAGFNHALDTVWESVLKAIGPNGWNNLYCVGHSLGGALAALTGSRLSRATAWLNLHVITFGQPRCGDRQWAQDMTI